MRTGPLVAGIILLVIGIGGYLYLQSYASDAQTSLGQLARSMNPNLQQTYRQILNYQIGAGIIAVIGLGLLVYGGVAKSKVPRSQAQAADGATTYALKSNKIFCRYCGKLRPVSGTLCSECGKPTSSATTVTKICVHCQAAVSEDSEFCANCGRKF